MMANAKKAWFVLMAASLIILPGAARAAAEAKTEPQKTEPIGYMKKQAPAFKLPSLAGERYTDKAPDTLDIAERAELAIRAMTEMTDPQMDYDIYFVSMFYRNPPVFRHQYSDLCIVKYYEALPLLRTITGSKTGRHVEHAWLESILKSIGPDGLHYIAIQGRPWLQGTDMYDWAPNICWPDATINSPKGKKFDFYADSVVMGRILAPLTIYGLLERDPSWAEMARRMTDRLGELLIDKGDYAYLPARLFVPGAKRPADAPMADGLNAEELGGRLIQGLAQYYKISRYEPARKMNDKLVNYLRRHAKFFDEQGRFISPDGTGKTIVGGHFHGHTIALLSFLEHATAVGDRELIDYVRKSYEWARDHAYGSSLTGWFPEAAQADYECCELCCVADMLALALKLSEAGAGDFYDDADRYTRNFFAEGQVTRTDWIDKAAASQKATPVAYNETSENVAKRHLGAFLGYVTGNDYGIWAGAPTGLAACCMGNAARTIYYVWQDTLREKDGVLTAHLLLNHASPWADLHSYIPYTGRVDLKFKKDCKGVRVRMPEWIKSGDAAVKCAVDGKPCASKWEGRYIKLNGVRASQVLKITFPISERTVKEKIGKSEYTLKIKGTTVVGVEPQGKYCPLYQREQYKKNQADWIKRERYVSKERIEW